MYRVLALRTANVLQASLWLGLPAGSQWARIRSQGTVPPGTDVVALTIDTPTRSRDEHRPASSLARFSGFYFEFFGRTVQQERDTDSHPYIRSSYDDGFEHIVEVWYGRLFDPEQDVDVEAVWRPGGLQVAIKRAGPDWKGPPLTAAGRAAHLLETFEPRFGGRRARTDDEALAEAVGAGREWLEDHPGATPADFRRADLADRLFITEKSLDERMRSKHFTMAMVREQLR